MTASEFREQGLGVVFCKGNKLCHAQRHDHAKLANGIEYCPMAKRIFVSTTAVYGCRVGQLTGDYLKETATVFSRVFIDEYPSWELNDIAFLD